MGVSGQVSPREGREGLRRLKFGWRVVGLVPGCARKSACR